MSDALIKACKREARHVHEYPSRLLVMAADALTAAQEENERLREALNFYADTSKYPAPLTGGLGELYYDCGQIARATLDGLPK